jgi:hypothetical protein
MTENNELAAILDYFLTGTDFLGEGVRGVVNLVFEIVTEV